MDRAQTVDRESSLFVARGLYVLRYDASGTGLEHPLAIVRAAPGSESSVEIVSAPGRAPVSSTARERLLSFAPARTETCKSASAEAASTVPWNAALKLESLGNLLETDTRVAASASRSEDQDPKTVWAEDILFVAHLARRGDVALGPNQWAAGPEAPAPIEGLEIRPLASARLRVEIQVMTAGRPPAWSSGRVPAISREPVGEICR